MSGKERRDQVCSTVGTPERITSEVQFRKRFAESDDFSWLEKIMDKMRFESSVLRKLLCRLFAGGIRRFSAVSIAVGGRM
jgi:hypothetical protein